MRSSSVFAGLIARFALGFAVASLLAGLALAEEKRPTKTDGFGDPLPAGAVARLGSTRFRHSERIWCLAFSPDGKSVASSGMDGTVRFWDVRTGRQTRVFSRNASMMMLAFRPDGAALAVADHNGHNPGIFLVSTDNVGEWRVTELPNKLGFHPADHGPSAVAFSPDGKLLASVKPNGEICLIDPVQGKLTAVLGRHDRDHVPTLVFSPDGCILASSGQDVTIRLWDVARRKALCVLRSEDTLAFPLVFSRDGKWLISGGGTQEKPDDWRSPWRNSSLRIWDAATGKQLRVFKDTDARSPVGSLALAPDGRTLAVGCDNTLRLRDVTTGKILRSMALPRNGFWPICKLSFSPDGKILAGGIGNMVGLWDVESGRLLNLDDGEAASSINAVALSSDGRLLATADAGGYLSLWDFPSRRLIRRVWGHESEMRRVAFSPDDKTLVSLSEYSRVRAWDVASGRQRYQFPVDSSEGSRPTEMAFAPDGKLLAYTYFSDKQEGGPRGIRLLDAATGAERQNLIIGDAVHGWFVGIGFSPDGNHLMGTTVDGEIYGWQRESERFIKKGVIGKDQHASYMAYTERGFLSVDAFSGKIQAFRDFKTGQPVRSFPEFPRLGHSLAISQDGRFLAAGPPFEGGNPAAPREGMLRVYEMATGQEVLRWNLPSCAACKALKFAPDGRTLVAGMADTTVLIWDLVPADKDAAKDMQALWTDLAANDAAKAYRARCRLLAVPEDALALLRRHLKPVEGVEEKRIQTLIGDLDSEKFDVREKATEQLRKLGELAEPAIRNVLASRPTLEMKRRLQDLLEDITTWRPSPEILRQLRALEALERLGTPEARRLLGSLAGGAAGARLTREARAALQRLQAHSGANP